MHLYLRTTAGKLQLARVFALRARRVMSLPELAWESRAPFANRVRSASQTQKRNRVSSLKSPFASLRVSLREVAGRP